MLTDRRHWTFPEFAHQGQRIKARDIQGREGRARYWKAFENLRETQYTRQAQLIRETLFDVRAAYEDAIRDSDTVTFAVRAVESARDDAREIFRRRIERLYVMVVVQFASQISDSLDGKMRPARAYYVKQTDDPFERGRDRFATAARTYVQQNAADLIREAEQTTHDRIVRATRSAVTDALRPENGWGVDRIAREMIDRSDDAMSFSRAVTIARTEVITASNYGSLTAARDFGDPLDKEWIATQDRRTRETHSEADTQIVGLDEQFVVGGELCDFPADPVLSAGERINCRCTQAYITTNR